MSNAIVAYIFAACLAFAVYSLVAYVGPYVGVKDAGVTLALIALMQAYATDLGWRK